MRPPTADDGALCAQVDQAIFFPAHGGSVRPAKAVCARCEVRDWCRESALPLPWLDGVWGGTTPKERKRLRRRKEAP